MTTTAVIAAPDQMAGTAIRALLDELGDVKIAEIADSPSRTDASVAAHDPEVVLVHSQLDDGSSLQVVRDLAARRPRTAVLLLTDVLTSDLLNEAMVAGARAVVELPVPLDVFAARYESAVAWAIQMRRHLEQGTTTDDGIGRGSIIAVAGAKGGVGTTTIAVHLAHHLERKVRGQSVCLVDLDLESGDVGNFLGISHRLDVSDIAKVSDELNPSTLNAAIHRGADGLSALLSPARLEDVGAVGDRETVRILAALRRQFDVVLVDVGAHVTPSTAAAVEMATSVLLVTTPDVLSLRGVHRVIESWQRFGVREAQGVSIVVNKRSKDDEIQLDAVGRLVPVQPMNVGLPLLRAAHERAVNLQDPAELGSKVWWPRIGELADAVGLPHNPPQSAAFKGQRPVALKGQRQRRRKGLVPRESTSETGQATLEFVGVLPMILACMLLLWQVSLWGMVAAYTSHASSEAARSASLGSSDSQIHADALASVPGWVQDEMTVSVRTNSVSVKSELPIVLPGFSTELFSFSNDSSYVREP